MALPPSSPVIVIGLRSISDIDMKQAASDWLQSPIYWAPDLLLLLLLLLSSPLPLPTFSPGGEWTSGTSAGFYSLPAELRLTVWDQPLPLIVVVAARSSLGHVLGKSRLPSKPCNAHPYLSPTRCLQTSVIDSLELHEWQTLYVNGHITLMASFHLGSRQLVF